jgi:anaerobic C4-dicarboxylate transporter
MDPRSPVRRLALITVAAATAFAGLLIALESVDPNSGAHGILFVMFMVAVLAVLGFAWSLVSALIADRRAPK